MKTLSVGQLIEMLHVAAVMLSTYAKTRTVSKSLPQPTEITPHQRSHTAFLTATLSPTHKEDLFGQYDK